ncbi:HD domain-containing protein [Vibrio splendidus]|nr:HD domain-containing protein [Vibrio splendidus]MCC4880746.1 hypothetical protein [Vibrio splendidus]
MSNFNLEVTHKIVRLSALLHDLGKSTKGFQYKLSSVINKDKHDLFSNSTTQNLADPLRHELLSTLLLLPLLEEGKLSDLSTPALVRDYFANSALNNLSHIKTSIVNAIARRDDENMHELVSSFDDNVPLLKSGGRLLCKKNWEHCSITSSIVWLILCHHRINAAHTPKAKMPTSLRMGGFRKPEPKKEDNTAFCELKINKNYINHHGFDNIDPFFEFTDTPLWKSDSWCLCVSNIVNELIQMKAFDTNAFTLNNYTAHALFYKGKTALIYGDHLGSAHSEICSHQDSGILTYANTRQDEDGVYRWADSLLSHTMKVTHRASDIFERLFIRENDEYRRLPVIQSANKPSALLPIGLTEDSPYYWQEHVTKELATIDKTRGFFGIMLSGTGSGKTKGCPMIMSNISEDTRFTLALGRKTLTQQAFRDYTSDIIGYKPSDVAILIGSHVAPVMNDIDVTGNGVMDMNNEEYSDCIAEDSEFDSPLFELFSDKSKEHSMLSSPISVMTLDHIIGLVCQRRSTHCKLMLNAMNNDLIIDELDDFDAKSLVSIGKLIYLFASFGRKVIISSATISPVIAESMMNAYVCGYEIHQQTTSNNAAPYVGFMSNKAPYLSLQFGSSVEALVIRYNDFISDVCEQLSSEPARRLAKHMSLMKGSATTYDEDTAFELIDKQVSELHDEHHIVDEDGFKLSFGFVRFNHVKSAQSYAIHLLSEDVDLDVTHKVMCYHSRMLNVDRFAVEEFLDEALKRNSKTPFENACISEIINEAKALGKTELVVIVSTTSIQETGRDHDYDWIVTEPLSDRSIIQSAGRVLRHRPNIEPRTPNIVIFTNTIKGYKEKSDPWGYPGIETDRDIKLGKINHKEPKYPVSFDIKRNLVKRIDDLGIIRDTSINTDVDATTVLSRAFIESKIDAKPAISRVNRLSESFIGALESVRNHDYLLSNADDLSSLGSYITNPSATLSTEHADKNPFRSTDAGMGNINLDVKLSNYRNGFIKSNWKKFRRSKKGFEYWNIDIKEFRSKNTDVDWSRVLLAYDIADKINSVSKTHEANKGSVEHYLSSAQITVGKQKQEIYYSQALGFIDAE